MDNFLILHRIGKNIDNYLLWVLDLTCKETKYISYCREKEIALSGVPILSDFVDYTTGIQLTVEDVDLGSIPAETDGCHIHRFDHNTSSRLRAINYSIIREDSKEIFVPCCGKHKDHDCFRYFAKYTNDYQIFDGVFIEGYFITDPAKFDSYIVKFDPSEIILDYTDNKDVLLRELRDYINDFFSASYKEVEIKITHPTGKEFCVIL